ncbi:tricarballylate dehydrogenase [Pelotomaculum schinkii]|uniref:Tricarballylate dehydrogenase n=1 Tax=Pelotomaculum schinkii TaxID=78350 RepID=A0A4Y7R8G4_9FIRM|nr:NAD(P)/FAD-dependent oxidoreductase [Pelotomaculum schinkii]TEB05066.1 tricarballylate dehydrogenase [Pelotomaculum schinkii]
MPGSPPYKVAVIGGGAAGITAAIAARRKGAIVTILESNQRIGKKILATGNGRCNLTNITTSMANYHGSNPRFAFSVLSQFGVEQTLDFFARLGVAHKVKEEGKVFPFSLQASSVLDVLRYELERIGVNVHCGAEVAGIAHNKIGFTLALKNGGEFQADRVIIATGGKAAPHFGSTGSGYALALSLGHSIVEPFPALVQLKLSSGYLKQIKGIKFEGTAEVVLENQSLQAASGEILFTEYGISGPPILTLSRKAGECLKKNQSPWLKLVLLDSFTGGELEELLAERFSNNPGKTLAFSFVGFINKQLSPVILKEAGVDLNKAAGKVTASELKKIAHILLDWRFPVTGTTSWPAAQVTAGGVDVNAINSKTLESRIVPTLYFAGEVLDIDGDCGGYNLQWAWSSGFIAGESAAGA